MKSVGIIAGAYYPVMSAEMHRTRHLAWDLPRLGWSPRVFALGTDFQFPAYIDTDSNAFFNPASNVTLISEKGGEVYKRFGIRDRGARGFLPMWRELEKSHRANKFDLLYFSTTQFPLFLIGPLFKRIHKVPYILDFHDPCYTPGVYAPEGVPTTFKRLLAYNFSKFVEWASVALADGVVSVSTIYLDDLLRRYKSARWARQNHCSVIPFAASKRDFDVAKEFASKNNGRKTKGRIVYIGAGGPIMERSFRVLCKSLARVRKARPDIVVQIEIVLEGTMGGWQNGGPTHLADIAQELGLSELVYENTKRVAFRRSLEMLLCEANGALILGVDQPGYMPSKLFSYALSGKPLLVIAREDGAISSEFAMRPELGTFLGFNSQGDPPEEDTDKTVIAYLEDVLSSREFNREHVVAEYEAANMAERHASLFDVCIRERNQKGDKIREPRQRGLK